MSTETAKNNYTEHRITLNARQGLEVRGVSDVVSFDEQSVILNTACGGLSIEGNGLHVNVLNVEQGIVTLEGKVDAITYFESDNTEKKSGAGILSRLFR